MLWLYDEEQPFQLRLAISLNVQHSPGYTEGFVCGPIWHTETEILSVTESSKQPNIIKKLKKFVFNRDLKQQNETYSIYK